MEPHEILPQLQGGDRRSIGRSEEVATAVIANPALLDALFDCLLMEDPVVRMRAADALEKATARQPQLLHPYKERLLQQAAPIPQQEVRWHVAQMLPRLELNAEERAAAIQRLLSYLEDDSQIVKTMAMQALADLAEKDIPLRTQLRALLETLISRGSPAVQSRGRKLLKKL